MVEPQGVVDFERSEELASIGADVMAAITSLEQRAAKSERTDSEVGDPIGFIDFSGNLNLNY